MKKLIAICLASSTLLFTGSFTRVHYASPKLYPELDNFFKSVKSMPVPDDHKSSLDNLTSYLVSSAIGNKEVFVVYSCTDNSFRSLAAQIFTQTLTGVYKYKKVKVYSCGMEKGSISSDLMSLLTGAGYKVTAKDNGTVEVKFSEDLSPILVTTTKAGDPALPKGNFLSMTLCSADENCSAPGGAAFKYALDFKNPKSGGDPGAAFKQIAADIYFGVNKAYDQYKP
jgi:hypothetical protein